MAGQIPIHILHYRSDSFGCGFYRQLVPGMAVQTVLGNPYLFRVTDAMAPICDANYFLSNGGVRVVRLQRWYGEAYRKYFR